METGVVIFWVCVVIFAILAISLGSDIISGIRDKRNNKRFGVYAYRGGDDSGVLIEAFNTKEEAIEHATKLYKEHRLHKFEVRPCR